MESPRAFRLLSEEETRDVDREVHALESRFTKRSPDLPFWTLGTASYLDAPAGGAAAYRKMARLSNPLLSERFGWLHERLVGRLAAELGAPVFTAEAFALPGFHVFGYHEQFTQPLASIHFDQQYEHVDFSLYGKPLDHLSLTLAIRLPACGAGLRLWPVFYEQLALLPPAERKVTLSGLRPELHRYDPGAFVLHSGHQLHQIAPAPEMKPGDERITLQAHAARVAEGWLLYW